MGNASKPVRFQCTKSCDVAIGMCAYVVEFTFETGLVPNAYQVPLCSRRPGSGKLSTANRGWVGSLGRSGIASLDDDPPRCRKTIGKVMMIARIPAPKIASPVIHQILFHVHFDGLDAGCLDAGSIPENLFSMSEEASLLISRVVWGQVWSLDKAAQ